MKLIVGLGNPGAKYKYTKHNIGFLFLDYFQNENNFSDFQNEAKFKGEISKGIIDGDKVLLLKPQTFMNLSGESIIKLVNFYKIDIDDIIVVYDDLSMDFSKIRFREKGSAGGHNGVKDIIKHFGDNFKRIKIGIGFNPNYEVSDWVLSKFKDEEISEFNKDIFSQVELLLKNKI